MSIRFLSGIARLPSSASSQHSFEATASFEPISACVFSASTTSPVRFHRNLVFSTGFSGPSHSVFELLPATHQLPKASLRKPFGPFLLDVLYAALRTSHDALPGSRGLSDYCLRGYANSLLKGALLPSFRGHKGVLRICKRGNFTFFRRDDPRHGSTVSSEDYDAVPLSLWKLARDSPACHAALQRRQESLFRRIPVRKAFWVLRSP